MSVSYPIKHYQDEDFEVTPGICFTDELLREVSEETGFNEAAVANVLKVVTDFLVDDIADNAECGYFFKGLGTMFRDFKICKRRAGRDSTSAGRRWFEADMLRLNQMRQHQCIENLSYRKGYMGQCYSHIKKDAVITNYYTKGKSLEELVEEQNQDL